MARVGRVLLWTVVLVAPGGFLLVPVLAASSLSGRAASSRGIRERLTLLLAEARRALTALPQLWSKR